MMKKFTNKKPLIYLSLLFLMSCGEEIIDIPLDDKSGKIVIEGNITDDHEPCYVRVSKSVKMSESSNSSDVNNAVVIVTDNKGQTQTLKYDSDGFYVTKNLVSHYGDTYMLSVTVDGVTYKAQSTMPQRVNFDNLNQSNVYGSGHNITPVFNDPPASGNHYLFKTWVQDEKAPSYTIFSDDVGNGQVNTKSLFTRKNLIENDTVLVEMQNIDLPVYNYFMAFPKATLENSDGGVVTANPVSNISNGALGYFSAHTSQRKTIIIKN